MNRYNVGDVVLVHTPLTRNPASWFGLMIRFGQWMRKSTRPYRYWNHAALVVSPDGDLAEALARGISATHISAYDSDHITVVPVGSQLSLEEQRHIVAFASREMGKRYGFLTIVSLAVTILCGGRLIVDWDRSWICSEFAAAALLRADIHFDRSPAATMPAHIAAKFGIGASVSSADTLTPA